MASLSSAAEYDGRLLQQVQFLQEAVEHFAIVDVDREIREPDGDEQVVDDQRCFNIRHNARRADGVEIALHELAVSATLRVLASPHRSDMITLERCPQLRRVLSGEPSQRDRQVKSQADLTATMIDEFVELAVCFLAPFAGQNLQILERRRIDRTETIRAIDTLGCFDQLFARHHGRRQIITKPL